MRLIDEGTHSSSSSLPGMTPTLTPPSAGPRTPRGPGYRDGHGAFTALGALDSALARMTDRIMRVTAFTLETVDANMMVAMLYSMARANAW